MAKSEIMTGKNEVSELYLFEVMFQAVDRMRDKGAGTEQIIDCLENVIEGLKEGGSQFERESIDVMESNTGGAIWD
jgi:hypothetical protein